MDNGYRRAYKRVPEAEPDTCQWILQQSAYTAWLSGSGSATFLLHGQMGCGKSVLTKHLLTHIRGSKTSDPPSENDEAAVLYHFCGSVSHNADTLESASNILRAMIYHFLVRRPSLFPTITEHTDVLDDYPPARTGSTLTSNQLSLSSLWTVLTTLLAASRHSSIYCFIDAIDECDPESIGTLLQLYRRSCRTELAAGTSVKFFISSRDGATETGLFDTMRGFPRFHHLEVKPVFVGPDLKVVVERSLSRMEWLAWSSGQRSQAQSLLTEKAEGMFLWAQTAITLIQDFADALPFASALELIDDMPRQMENLYRHALRRLFESLDKKVVQSVRKVLGWLLHVVRPLSVAELSLALAIDPAERTLAKFPDRLIDAGRFVQKYLSPFVVLVPPESKAPSQNSPVPDNAPDFTAKDPRMIVGIVHQTAQDFLRKVFSGELDEPCFTALRIAKSTCHEELARICLGYLCCEELQLGWINDDKINEWGQVAVDETTKALLVTRLSQHALLGYAAVHWPSHLVHCEDRGPDDAYGLALDFLLNHHGSVACSEQVRQYIKKPELDWYWVISAPLHKAAQIDSLTLCRRILEGGLADINSTNNSGDTPLIVACAHKVNTELPDICVKIGSLLLDHGADSSLRDKFERTAMHYAAANGQVGLLNLLLRGSGHGSIEAKDDEGETPLHDAVDFDHLEATEILLNAGSDIDSTDCEGCTPLHCAAKHGHTRVLRFLLQHQASVNARDNNLNTPLHYACLMDRTDCAKALFDWGCAKDARDKDGLTSLAVAAQTGSKELVQLLCSHGANINSKTHDGTSPLVLACARGDLDIVNFFLQNGAKPDAGNDVGSRPLHAAVSGHNLSIVQGLIHEGVSIDAKGSNGWTPLHVAASQGQSSIASALLASGAGVNIKDDQGATALHFAAAKDDVGMIDILLAAGADPDLETIDLETSLHWAAAEGAVNSARRLLAQKAKPNQKNKVGQTPLHLSTGNREISSLLLGAGSDPSAQSTEFGYTPAHLAAFNGEKDVLELLLDNGADKEARGTKGPTPLLLAAQNGHLDCCELLLSRGAYLEAHDIWNATPLWIAAGHGQTEAVELLLKHGANVHAQNEDGMTPLCVACRDGYTGVVKLLLSRGAKVVQPGHSGLTPLDIAIVEERKDVVMELLSSAEPFAVGGLTLGLLARLKDPAALELGVSRLDDTDPNPELVALWPVALAEAASEGRSDRVETFLNHGVDTDSLFGESGSHKLMSFPVSDKTADVVESLLKRGVLQPNRQDNDGWNILHWASFFESPRTVEAVLRHADSTAITARTKAGRTALHGAARNEQSTSIAEALLQTPLGADVDCRDSDGCTPLHVAVATGTLAMTELLLDHGANPMAVTSRGASVLHLAFQNSDQEVPIYLLGLKMSEVINQRTRKGVAPLHVCASRGSRIALEMLLSIGAQADSVDGDEEDPLYYAVRSRNLETLYTLLEHGVQPDRPNKHGWTALHFAASSGSEWATVAEALLDVGASLTADNNGWFPIDIAAESSEGPMLELLRKRGGKNSKPLDWHYPIPSQWNVKDKSTELTLSDNNCVVELPGRLRSRLGPMALACRSHSNL